MSRFITTLVLAGIALSSVPSVREYARQSFVNVSYDAPALFGVTCPDCGACNFEHSQFEYDGDVSRFIECRKCEARLFHIKR